MATNKLSVEEHLQVVLGNLALLARFAELERTILQRESLPTLGADIDQRAAGARADLAVETFRRLKIINRALDAEVLNLEVA